jgi:hypothetical protein
MILVFDLGGPLLTYALLFSKLVPYACALGLSIWTLAYGEREKRKAERLAGSA